MPEAELGARTGGVWTAAQAYAAGVSAGQLRWRVASGSWQVLRRGVYADGGVQPDPGMRAWAAVLAAGGPVHARAAGRTAARLLGLPLIDDDDPLLPPELRQHSLDDVAGSGPSRTPGLRITRLSLSPADRVLVAGIPCLSPLRTLLDLSGLLTHEALVCALDAALQARLVTPPQVEAAVAAQAGQRHVRALRRALAVADGRAESPLETLSRLLLLPVLPGLVPQVVVLDRCCRLLARLDLADERLRFGVESDGARWHRGQAALAADRRREQRLAPYGWRLERVTWVDVRRNGSTTRDRLLAAAQRRAA